MTAKLRVLRVIARMNVGGPALQVTALTDGLDSSRFESRLLVGVPDDGEADYVDLRAPHIKARTIAGLSRSPSPLGDAGALVRVLHEVRDFRPHIVHTHTAKAGVLGRLAAWAGRAPATVHTFHGHLLHGYFSPPMRSAVVLVERTLARRTTRLVAVGARVRDELLAAGIGRPEQFSVVAPGVSLPRPPSRASARQLLGLPADGPVVAFVARLTQIKRPDRMIEVARRVSAHRGDTIFLVAGEGGLLEATKAQAAAAGVNARFLGWRPDVETVYAAADLVLLTSDNEGMPVSLIEASHIGRPAVTTAAGGAGEVVVDGVTGCVTACDVDELASAVLNLIADDQRRVAMGAAAAKWAAERFGSERLVSDMAGLYEEIAEERGLGRARG